MSIQSQVERLETAKSDIATAIGEKGVTVPQSASLSAYGDYVRQIEDGATLEQKLLNGTVIPLKVQQAGQQVTVTTSTTWTSQSTSAGTAYWYQTVTVPGITASSEVSISLDADGLNQLLLDGVTAIWAENDNGTCTLKTLGAAPTTTLVLYLTLTGISVTPTLSTLSPGALLSLNEGGNPALFYVATHNYEIGLNGPGRTLLVRKDLHHNQEWNISNVNAYDGSTIDSWLNGTYKNMLDAGILPLVGTTKIRYTPGNGNWNVDTLERAVFPLSATELGKLQSWFNVEGSALPIADTLEIAYLGSYASEQWTRSPVTSNNNSAVYLGSRGNETSSGCTISMGYRPAFTLPGSLLLNETPNSDGSYSPLID